jgi:hypothetical protein
MSFKKTLCRIQKVLISSLTTVRTTCSTILMLNYPSIIRPDDENFMFGPSSVSRSFELFQLASVRTSQQCVRTSFNVRLAMGFLSKTQIWEDSCNHPDDVDSCSDALIYKASCAFKVQPFG